MAIRFYFDEMMPRRVAEQVAAQSFEVIMAVDVAMTGKADPDHLTYAAEHGAMLVTRDAPFAGLTARHTDHAGLICWTGADNDFGGMVDKLTEFANAHTMDDVEGRVYWVK